MGEVMKCVMGEVQFLQVEENVCGLWKTFNLILMSVFNLIFMSDNSNSNVTNEIGKLQMKNCKSIRWSSVEVKEKDRKRKGRMQFTCAPCLGVGKM
jgi:hypothetical protein